MCNNPHRRSLITDPRYLTCGILMTEPTSTSLDPRSLDPPSSTPFSSIQFCAIQFSSVRAFEFDFLPFCGGSSRNGSRERFAIRNGPFSGKSAFGRKLENQGTAPSRKALIQPQLPPEPLQPKAVWGKILAPKIQISIKIKISSRRKRAFPTKSRRSDVVFFLKIAPF